MKKCGKKRKIDHVIGPIIQPSYKKQNINVDFNDESTDDDWTYDELIDDELTDDALYELRLECLKAGLNEECDDSFDEVKGHISSNKRTKCCSRVVFMVYCEKNSRIWPENIHIFNKFARLEDLSANKLEMLTKELQTFHMFGCNGNVCNDINESSEFIQCIKRSIDIYYQSIMKNSKGLGLVIVRDWYFSLLFVNIIVIMKTNHGIYYVI